MTDFVGSGTFYIQTTDTTCYLRALCINWQRIKFFFPTCHRLLVIRAIPSCFYIVHFVLNDFYTIFRTDTITTVKGQTLNHLWEVDDHVACWHGLSTAGRNATPIPVNLPNTANYLRKQLLEVVHLHRFTYLCFRRVFCWTPIRSWSYALWVSSPRCCCCCWNYSIQVRWDREVNRKMQPSYI